VKTILVAGAVSLLLALLGTPLAIRVFSRRGYGQLIREEGPAAHVTKRGTPTMGGTVIVIASVVGYFVGNLATGQTPQASGLLVMMLMAGLGLVGFIDDFIKIYKQRSLGLRSSAKLAGQAVVGAVFALLVLQQRFADGYDITPADAHLSFLRDFGPTLGLAPFVLWIVILIAGTSNAVNLTDGLDGLATGSACLVLAAYVLIGLVAILVGLYCLRHHDVTIFLLALLVGAFWIVHGVAELASALTSGPMPGRGLRVVVGLFSIAAGAVVLFWPGISLVLMLTVFGAWLIFYAVILGALAFRLRRQTKSAGRSRRSAPAPA